MIWAPVVSASKPMGLLANQSCEIADGAASDARPRIFKINEVYPIGDVKGNRSKLAANIIMRALARGTE